MVKATIPKEERRRRERETMLIHLISVGVPVKYACLSVGLDVEDFERWKNKYPEFLSRVAMAEAGAMAFHLRVVSASAEGDRRRGVQPDWKAAAWFLEKRFPKLFGPNAGDEMASMDVGAKGMLRDLSTLSEEQLRVLLREVLDKDT